MPLPSKRNPEQLRLALQNWFRARRGGDVTVGPITVPGGTGMSSETLLFDVIDGDKTDSLVARVRPDMDDWPVFPTYDLAKQAGAMRLVGEHSDVPVPKVIAVEEDESFLGAPFIVMSCVEGRALPDLPPYTFGGSFLDDLDTIGRAEFQRNFVHTQARIHAIDLDTVDTSFIGPASGDVLDRQLIAQRSYFDWARDGLDIPIIDEGLEWLAANRPVDPGDTVVNWGDARPGNLLVAGIRPVAALDWEMVDLGPAGVDVGWAIFMHSFFQFVAAMFDLPGFPDLFQVDEVMADYVAAGGSEIRDLDWYVMYGSVRFAIISVRTSSREIAYGNRPPVDDPEDLIMHLPMLREQLASR